MDSLEKNSCRRLCIVALFICTLLCINPGAVEFTSQQNGSWSSQSTWSGSMEQTMDRLSPGGGYSMMDLLNYIREGFRPTNTVLKDAGAPDDGSPDIGAVDLDFVNKIVNKDQSPLWHINTIANPLTGNITISFTVPLNNNTQNQVAIYSMDGRLLRIIDIPFGVNYILWDRCDMSGKAVSSGMYLICLEGHRYRVSGKVTIL